MKYVAGNNVVEVEYEYQGDSSTDKKLKQQIKELLQEIVVKNNEVLDLPTL